MSCRAVALLHSGCRTRSPPGTCVRRSSPGGAKVPGRPSRYQASDGWFHETAPPKITSLEPKVSPADARDELGPWRIVDLRNSTKRGGIRPSRLPTVRVVRSPSMITEDDIPPVTSRLDPEAMTAVALEAGMVPAAEDEIAVARQLAADLMQHDVVSIGTLQAVRAIQPAAMLVYKEDGRVTGVFGQLVLRPDRHPADLRGRLRRPGCRYRVPEPRRRDRRPRLRLGPGRIHQTRRRLADPAWPAGAGAALPRSDDLHARRHAGGPAHRPQPLPLPALPAPRRRSPDPLTRARG